MDNLSSLAPILLIFASALTGLIGWLLRAIVHDLIDRRREDAVQRTVREFEQTIAEAAQALKDSRHYIKSLEAMLRGIQSEVSQMSGKIGQVDDRIQAYVEAGRIQLTRRSDRVETRSGGD